MAGSGRGRAWTGDRNSSRCSPSYTLYCMYVNLGLTSTTVVVRSLCAWPVWAGLDRLTTLKPQGRAQLDLAVQRSDWTGSLCPHALSIRVPKCRWGGSWTVMAMEMAMAMAMTTNRLVLSLHQGVNGARAS